MPSSGNRSNNISTKPSPNQVTKNNEKNNENLQQQNEIEIDPDDPCIKKEIEIKKEPVIFKPTIGLDPR